MATHAELVDVFGAANVITLERAGVESHGLRAEDVDMLCSVGIPVSVDPFFTMTADGPYETFTMFEAGTAERTVSFLILGKGAGGDEVAHADQIRYALEVESGNVCMLALENGEFTPDAEAVNTTLDSFVEFLHRIERRRRELAGTTAEEARPYTGKLVDRMRALDERALAPGAFWGGVFEALLQTGVPRIREGSRAAISAALAALLPDDQPLRWGTGARFGEGVRELSAHRADGCWLLVTWGFSDLEGVLDPDESGGQGAEFSGLGFELTMRVPRGVDDEMPPGWALETLHNLGKYVFGHDGRALAHGHRMEVAGQLGPGDSRLAALAFVTDPQLGTVGTPGGRVDFVTAVGVTREELEEAQATGNEAVLARLTGDHGAPVTDVSR